MRWVTHHGLRIVGLVLLIMILPRLDLAGVARRMSSLQPGNGLLAALLFVGLIAVRSWQWHQIIRLFGGRSTMPVAFASLWIGLFWGMLTPGHVGEFARALHMSRLGVRGGAAVLAVVSERGVHLWVLLVLAAVALLSRPGEVSPWAMIVCGLAGCVVAGCALRGMAYSPAHRFMERPLRGLRQTSPIRRLGDAVLEQAGRLSRISMRAWIEVAVLSLGSWVLTGCLSWSLARGVGIGLTWADGVGYMAVGSVVSIVPVSVLGLGTRDAAMILLFERGGRSWEEAVVFSSILLLITVVNLLLGLVVWYVSERSLLRESSLGSRGS